MWVFGRPRGNVIFEWQISRGREGPKAFLAGFKGELQTDGYQVYRSLVLERNQPMAVQGQPPELLRTGTSDFRSPTPGRKADDRAWSPIQKVRKQ